MTTIKKNILIAQFMGAKLSGESRLRIAPQDIWLPIHGVLDKRNLKFHSSWDWLMPVVAKLGKMNNAYDTEEFLLIRDELCTGRIETVYSTVMDCIEHFKSEL